MQRNIRNVYVTFVKMYNNYFLNTVSVFLICQKHVFFLIKNAVPRYQIYRNVILVSTSRDGSNSIHEKSKSSLINSPFNSNLQNVGLSKLVSQPTYINAAYKPPDKGLSKISDHFLRTKSRFLKNKFRPLKLLCTHLYSTFSCTLPFLHSVHSF